MFCEKCGNKLEDGTKICPSCGALIEEEQLEDIANSIGTQTTTEANEIKNEKESTKTDTTEKNSKWNWSEFWTVLVIFAFNSYVIVHNFCVHDGYFWAILGIIINVVILLSATDIMKSLIPKINPKFGYLFFAIVFLIMAFISSTINNSFEKSIEETSVSIVNEIIAENFGDYIDVAKCTSVTILKETGDDTYKAEAHLDNGEDLIISIEYYKKTDQVYVNIDFNQLY